MTTIYFPSEDNCEIEIEVEGTPDDFRIKHAFAFVVGMKVDCTDDVITCGEFDVFISRKLKEIKQSELENRRLTDNQE